MFAPSLDQPVIPHSPCFPTSPAYIRSLLAFSQNPLFQTLCGGVHMLDFFRRPPPNDLYSAIIPEPWRNYLDPLPIHDVLDLLMRADLKSLDQTHPECPSSLKEYITMIRDHCLIREYHPRWIPRRHRANGSQDEEEEDEEVSRAKALRKPRKKGEIFNPEEERRRRIFVGMSPKKMHEVENFSRFLQHLLNPLATSTTNSATPITHIVDFGSGQGYLPRLLSYPPFSYNIVALERKPENISGAKSIDAALIRREAHLRKKRPESIPDGPNGSVLYVEKSIDSGDLSDVVDRIRETELGNAQSKRDINMLVISLHSCGNLANHGVRSLLHTPEVGAIAIIGCCYNLITENAGKTTHEQQSVINTTLTANKSDRTDLSAAIATLNLHPYRTLHPRLLQPFICSTCPPSDPSDYTSAQPPSSASRAGFPLSNTFSNPPTPTRAPISLNITARMMACQAPPNWTSETSASFFKRHFYRALLQKVLLDCGLLSAPGQGGGIDGTGPPETVTLGTLRPVTVYDTFPSYCVAAVAKVGWALPGKWGKTEVLEGYERVYSTPAAGLTEEGVWRDVEFLRDEVGNGWGTGGGRHNLEVLWSLMAFSAGIVEALIVVDRWCWLAERRKGGLWLEEDQWDENGGERVGAAADNRENWDGGEREMKEEGVVEKCWVEAVFEYEHSPRNLVVVGVKQRK